MNISYLTDRITEIDQSVIDGRDLKDFDMPTEIETLIYAGKIEAAINRAFTPQDAAIYLRYMKYIINESINKPNFKLEYCVSVRRIIYDIMHKSVGVIISNIKHYSIYEYLNLTEIDLPTLKTAYLNLYCRYFTSNLIEDIIRQPTANASDMTQALNEMKGFIQKAYFPAEGQDWQKAI